MAFTTGDTISDVETLFINRVNAQRMFSYLPPHGKKLAALASRTFPGDVRARMSTRELNALQRDTDSGKAQMFIYHRFLVAVVAATAPAISIGDAVWYDTSVDVVSPASAFAWGADLPTTQASFKAVFLGIALTAKAAATASQKVQVDISNETLREFTCTSETHNLDEYCGMKKDVGNNLLASQLEKAVAGSAPFRVRRVDGIASARVLASWSSAYLGQNIAGNQ
jgi:hypothetical protein